MTGPEQHDDQTHDDAADEFARWVRGEAEGLRRHWAMLGTLDVSATDPTAWDDAARRLTENGDPGAG
jgi:hypothetical protein